MHAKMGRFVMTQGIIARTRIGAAVVVAALSIAGPGFVPAPAAAQDSLTVALYPWVPRPQQFVDAVQAAWEEVQPGIELTIIMDGSVWDGGYHTPVQPSFDVFVFDAMYFEDYQSQGLLTPIAPDQVTDPDDFVVYAREGVTVDGDFMALPLLGCANVLFYPTSNEALDAATTIDEVNAALGQCTYISEIPPDRRGTMVDMSGSTSTATLYLDILHSITGQYPPPLATEIDPDALDTQRDLLRIASVLNATAETSNAYQRADWYSDGYGESWIGFTESLSQLTDAQRDALSFKPMPFADGTQPPLFYADVVAVNTSTADRGTQALAIELADVITSTDTVVASIGTGTYGEPQFLLATRESAFAALEVQDPYYARLAELLDTDPLLFKLGADVREWIDTTGQEVRTDVFEAPQCGCDVVAASFIPDNAAAPAICEPTCADHGGWNGQWTNQPPAPSPSVCGCNACTVDSAALAVEDTPPSPIVDQ